MINGLPCSRIGAQLRIGLKPIPLILKELVKISLMANQHVVVIGASSTGAAIAHDIALRD